MGLDPKNKDDIDYLYSINFSSLCADADSAVRYKEIEEKRKKNIDDSSYTQTYVYELNFIIRQNKKDKKYIVVSGQYPSTLKGKLPETFGILLDPHIDDDLKYLTDNDKKNMNTGT